MSDKIEPKVLPNGVLVPPNLRRRPASVFPVAGPGKRPLTAKPDLGPELGL